MRRTQRCPLLSGQKRIYDYFLTSTPEREMEVMLSVIAKRKPLPTPLIVNHEELAKHGHEARIPFREDDEAPGNDQVETATRKQPADEVEEVRQDGGQESRTYLDWLQEVRGDEPIDCDEMFTRMILAKWRAEDREEVEEYAAQQKSKS
jgi:hypothetical protein